MPETNAVKRLVACHRALAKEREPMRREFPSFLLVCRFGSARLSATIKKLRSLCTKKAAIPSWPFNTQ